MTPATIRWRHRPASRCDGRYLARRCRISSTSARLPCAPTSVPPGARGTGWPDAGHRMTGHPDPRSNGSKPDLSRSRFFCNNARKGSLVCGILAFAALVIGGGFAEISSNGVADDAGDGRRALGDRGVAPHRRDPLRHRRTNAPGRSQLAPRPCVPPGQPGSVRRAAAGRRRLGVAAPPAPAEGKFRSGKVSCKVRARQQPPRCVAPSDGGRDESEDDRWRTPRRSPGT